MTKEITIKEHEIVKAFPKMQAPERLALRNSIIENGLTVPVVIWQHPDKDFAYLIDGRHRKEIVEELLAEGIHQATNGNEIKLKYEKFIGTESEALKFATTMNGPARRNSTSSQIAASVVKTHELDYKYRKREARAAGKPIPEYVGDIAEQLAQTTGTNRTYIFNCQKIYRDDPDSPNILDMVINGEKTIPEALAGIARIKQNLPPFPTAEELAAEGEGDEETTEVENAAEEEAPEIFNGLKCLVAPEHMEIFAQRDTVREVVKNLKKSQADFEAYADTNGGKLCNKDETLAAYRALIRSIKDTQPHVECPYCSGTGKNPDDPKKRCGHCKGVKYLDKLQWKVVPQELKDTIPDNTKGGKDKDD